MIEFAFTIATYKRCQVIIRLGAWSLINSVIKSYIRPTAVETVI